MESNEISMFMDAKLDINIKKPEAAKFKSWTKCLVKIEAIKCLPCFLRITFIRNVEDESANLSVPINIPGITISLASSRTKQHSYGIFWIQNRKRCFIYFAFDSDASCKRHMKWMKKSIKNMELHRQLFLETRRSSRDRIEGGNLSYFSEFQTQYDRRNNKNPQDILGPLPQIPSDMEGMNWSRRVSGVSGIYEEIPEFQSVRRNSRVSIASGIYEEMKPSNDFKTISEEALDLAPPLPPRKRINTAEAEYFIPRSNTNPESDLAKKKKYKNVLENIFGRSKRSESVSEGKVSTPEDMIKSCHTSSTPDEETTNVVYANSPYYPRRHKIFVKENIENKRNSFSSPDLSKINLFDQFESPDPLGSLSTEVAIADLSSSLDEIDLRLDKLNTESPPDVSISEFNISERIQPNFNFSCNSSTINLVGSNLNIKASGQTSRILIDDISGYCAMAPIKREFKQASAVSNDSDKENDEKDVKLEEKCKDDSAVYENMHPYQNVYENLKLESSKLLPQNKQEEEKSEDYYKTPRKLVTSIDDKVSSYYPNSCDTVKSRRRCSSNIDKDMPEQIFGPIQSLTNLKINRRENLYISSPQKILDHRRNLCTMEKQKKSPLMARKVADNVYTVMRLEENAPQNIMEIAIESTQPFQNIDFKFDDTKNELDLNKPNKCSNADSTSRIYQKYATITRISPTNKYFKKNSSGAELNTPKKFASLPRFKKIDFSPLKLKINNVLQRHHNDAV